MRAGLRLLSILPLVLALGWMGEANLHGQPKEPPKDAAKDPNKDDKKLKYKDISFLTCDGLRLFGNWYPSSKGGRSDVVLMLPNYRSDLSKGEWNALAEELQKEGFAVLIFDYRGHGKSKTIKTFNDMKIVADTATSPWNKLMGVPLGQPGQANVPTPKNGPDVGRFKDSIFPYLVNDIAAARRFLDGRNDEGECNVGKLNIIADRDSCGLAMLWMATEFKRVAIYQKNQFDIAPSNHFGGRDLVSAVFLSYKPGAGTSAVLNNILNSNVEIEAKLALKEKIAMCFVQGDGDKESQGNARTWFNRFGIPSSAKDDPRTGKFLVDVKGGKTLQGINLIDPTKGLDTSKQVVEFLKEMRKKNLSGMDYISRNVNAELPQSVPLLNYGLKYP